MAQTLETPGSCCAPAGDVILFKYDNGNPFAIQPQYDRVMNLTPLRDPEQATATVTALLNTTMLHAFGHHLRVAEVETYLHAPYWPDPYVHRDPHQLHAGRWYLHRRGGTLKNGTFKGLDLTYGCLPKTYGGLLLRTVVTADDRVISGPCNVVHHLMSLAATAHIAELDAALTRAPPTLEACEPRTHRVFRTARVGLGGSRPFHDSPERYLTEPRRIKKGRPELLRALVAEGWSTEAIRDLTGSPRPAIDRYR